MRTNKRILDPGLGTSANENQKRILESDGKFNIKHIHRDVQFRDLYYNLINQSWRKFFIIIISTFIVLNIFFAILYVLVDDTSMQFSQQNILSTFWDAFNFSCQTFTTVGYGRWAPGQPNSGFISSFEAMVGLLYFAFATGLLYGRFSRATANLKFSKIAVMRTLNDDNTIMFRFLHKHPDIIMEVRATVIIVIKKRIEGELKYEYFPTNLERNQITFLTYAWTVVVLIDQNNPLYGLSPEQFKEIEGEIIISIKYYDNTFSQTVYQSHSYLFSEVAINSKFSPIIKFTANGSGIINHRDLDLIEAI